MTIMEVVGKACICSECGWIGPYSEVKSMAEFEFCPACDHRYTGFMPEAKTCKYCDRLVNSPNFAHHFCTGRKTQDPPLTQGDRRYDDRRNKNDSGA